ncbi:MAG: hypothetical protein ACLR8Y_08680 [Alistipes indistinctus]
MRRPQERPAKNKRVPGPAPRPGNGEKAVAVAIKTATGTENPFRKTWQASTSISLFAKVAAITATLLRTSLERRRELLAALHAELELRAGAAGSFPAGEPLCPANPRTDPAAASRTAPTTTSRTDQTPVSQTNPAKGPGVITLSAANRIETLYFGGGTPSLLTPHELGDFIRQVREQWPDAPLEEVTVEANPDDLSYPTSQPCAAKGPTASA